MQHYEDPELTILISRGNKQAFEIIYDRFHRRLYFMAMKYLKSKDLAEDAVQDIFVNLWQNKKNLDPSKSLKKYLFTCLKNHVLNMIRNKKNKLLSGYEMKEEDFPGHDNLMDEINHSDLMAILNRGLSELSERRKKVVELKVLEGLSNTEVSKKLFISINTVKVHYYHGSRFIKDYLNKHSDIIGEKKPDKQIDQKRLVER